MHARRTALALAAFAVAGVGLVGWALHESRQERRASLEALELEARLLVEALGPGLAATSIAGAELEEQLASRLLENARLLAALEAAGALDDALLNRHLFTAGLASVAIVDREGGVLHAAGDPIPPVVRAGLAGVLAGPAEELTREFPGDAGHDHLAAAVARPRGGAVLVAVDLRLAYAFGRRLGVDDLLDRVIEVPGVLYLQYREDPGAVVRERSWDEGPIPAAPPGRHTVRDRDVYDVTVPVPTQAGRTAALRVGLDAAPLVRVGVTAARRTIVVGAVLAIVGLLGGAVAFTLRLRDREREAAVARLAESEEARRRGERLAEAGALAAGLAHEVRSPLNAIGMAAQRILRRHAEDGECSRFATTIRAEVGRLDGVLKGFLDLARPGSGERVETGLLDLARDVAGLLEPEAQAAGVRLVAAGEAVTLAADRDAVRRAILNLVRNAIVVSPADSTVEITVERAERRARIAVRDRGPGVPGDLRDRLFEPFVSGRTDGAGLGLALVRRIAEEHGGAARLADREGGGAEAVLELPMTRGAVP